MTEIDKKIVAFIIDYYKEHQFYPIYSEIAEGIHRAKSTVHIYIKKLEDEGVIVRKSDCSSQYRLLNMEFINRNRILEEKNGSRKVHSSLPYRRMAWIWM